MCQQLGRENLQQRLLAEIEANFKNINKNIVCLGQSLYNNKELRELFVNIVEKIVEPFKQFKFSAEDITQVNLTLKFVCFWSWRLYCSAPFVLDPL